MIEPGRLRTPSADQALLIEPSPARIHAALKTDWSSPLRRSPLLDTTIGALRAELRAALGLGGQVVMTGHQPEFVHAGVLAKTIANHALARRSGARALFLVADSDVPKHVELTVPRETPSGLERVRIPLPGLDRHLPAEMQPPLSRSAWQACFARIAELLPDRKEVLLGGFAEAWLGGGERELDYCAAIQRGHGAVEDLLGLTGITPIRMSALAQTKAFRAFAAHLILNARAFAADHNRAQAAYRQRHKLRNPQRPVPPLIVEHQRVELPFWLVRAGQPRARLFVEEAGDDIRLYADQALVSTTSQAALASSERHTQPWAHQADGWQLRPRALMLSSFVRLFLADLFIHGIGGAKYDEVTDEFVGSFFDAAAPPICCISATLCLPLSHSGTTPAILRDARHAARDIRYNPQRYVEAPAALAERRTELIRKSGALRAAQPHDHVSRRRVFDAIRGANAEMLAGDPATGREVVGRVETLETRLRQDSIARDREYFIGLHSIAALRALTRGLDAALA